MAGLSISGLASGMDTQAAIEQMLSNYTSKITKSQKNISWLNWQQTAYKQTASSLKVFQDTYFSNTKMDTNFMSKSMFKKFNSTVKIDGVESDAATVTALAGAVPSSYSIKVHDLAVADKYSSSTQLKDTTNNTANSSTKLRDLGITDNNTSFVINDTKFDINIADGTYRAYKTDAADPGTFKAFGSGAENVTIRNITEMVNKSDAGVTMTFNSLSGKASLESKTEGVDGQIKNLTDPVNAANSILSTFKLLDPTSRTLTGSDAKIEVDGNIITRPTNEINTGDGVLIKLNKTSAGKTIDVEVSSDVDSLMDNIKKFVEEYNKVIKSLNTQTSERRAKTTDKKYYDPLTEDEKKNMTENEIKTWEAKAKTGIMYGDSTLKNISSSLRDFLYDSIDIGDGKTLSLYQIGISTSKNVKTESGQLIIDEDKLRKAIEENPDGIATLFSNKDATDSKKNGIAVKMSAAIDRAIKTSGDTYGTLILKAGGENVNLDQNYMYKQIKEENQTVANLMRSMEKKRESYQRMFTRMELAMNKANAQSSWLTQKA